MVDDIIKEAGKKEDLTLSAAFLNSILNPGRDITSVLNDAADEAFRIGQCDHIFLSRYKSAANEFVPAAWKSSFAPTAVSLKKKFMGEEYLSNRVILINDLDPYNYRLSPDTARMGFKSMIGVPIAGVNSLLGIIECYSKKPSYFTDEMAKGLMLLAKQTGLVLERAELKKSCSWLSIESNFFYEIHESGPLSGGLLLYRLGESLAALLEPDGLAVFGIEPDAKIDILQEVFARGFPMNDINLIKKAIQADFIEKLKHFPDHNTERPAFFKYPAAGKLLYVVPVLPHNQVEGVIIYYWAKSRPDVDLSILENKAMRLIRYTAITLRRNSLYSNIKRISFSDPLTEITNRRLFDYLLAREFANAKKYRSPMGLLLIDLDHFKRINDKYGHAIGDEVLKKFAILLKQFFHSSHITARYGGEEFAVIMPNTKFEDVIAAGEGLRKLIEQNHLSTEARGINISVSIGIAAIHDFKKSAFANPAELLQAADKALYKAKHDGRNRVVAIFVTPPSSDTAEYPW